MHLGGKLSSVVACAHETQKMFQPVLSRSTPFRIARASDIYRQLGLSAPPEPIARLQQQRSIGGDE